MRFDLFILAHFWATVCKTVRPMLSDRCLSVLSVMSVGNVGVLWSNGCMDQDESRHAGRPRPWPHCVQIGTQLPSPKGHSAPIFGPFAAKWLCGSRCYLVRRQASAQATLYQMGTSLPYPKRGQSPQIFGPCLLWPNGWMDQDGTWHGDRPQPKKTLR